MRNPSPMAVFHADVGRREDAEYCSVGGGKIVEMQRYGVEGICVLRVWEAIMPDESVAFNAHIVDDWKVRCERWYPCEESVRTEFESVCSGESQLREFIQESC